jgi:hypothetical protein
VTVLVLGVLVGLVRGEAPFAVAAVAVYTPSAPPATPSLGGACSPLARSTSGAAPPTGACPLNA